MYRGPAAVFTISMGFHQCPPHLGIDCASNHAIIALKLARRHVDQGGEEHDRAAVDHGSGVVVGEAAKKLWEWYY